jgi:tRNA pseudouridine32 synthase/23S rRNA pseudouridine746 synthase
MTPTILFQDQRFVVIDKPAGLAVHPGPSKTPSVEDCFAQLSRRKDGPWLAHRLDTDTAGCLAIALRRAPLIAAQEAFTNGTVRKTYWAIVDGIPTQDSGTITAPLRRVTTKHAGWRMIVDHQAGQPAVTDWQILGRGNGLCWLELRPRTGRSHQIRVHCAKLGTPIRGDERYGTKGSTLHLLARSIHIPLDPPVDATAPPPAHMRAALLHCGCPQSP